MQLSQSIQVSGFSLFGPDPIGALHVPIDTDAGITTLYGLNGSGKTRVMNAMRLCLSGVGTPSRAFAHLVFTSEWLGWSSLLIEDLSTIVDLRLRRVPDASGWDMDEASHVERHSLWAERVGLLRKDLATIGDDLALAPDAVGVTVEAVGTQREPKWDVHLSTTVTANQPEFDRLGPLRDLGEREATPPLTNEAARAVEHDLAAANVVGTEWAVVDLQMHNLRSHTVRPDWVPVRVAQIFDLAIKEDRIAIVHAGADIDDINDDSADLIRAQPADAKLWPSDHQRAVVDNLSTEASEYASALFGVDATLVYRVLETNRTGQGRLGWFWTHDYGVEIPIEEASSGEQLIAVTAISLALNLEGRDVTAIIFFDEPERSLHPQAVERIAIGFGNLRSTDNVTNTALYSLVFATHAPALVEPERASIVHIDRHPNGEVRANRMQLNQWSEPKQLAESLGWGTADVLQKIRSGSSWRDATMSSSSKRSSAKSSSVEDGLSPRCEAPARSPPRSRAVSSSTTPTHPSGSCSTTLTQPTLPNSTKPRTSTWPEKSIGPERNCWRWAAEVLPRSTTSVAPPPNLQVEERSTASKSSV